MTIPYVENVAAKVARGQPLNVQEMQDWLNWFTSVTGQNSGLFSGTATGGEITQLDQITENMGRLYRGEFITPSSASLSLTPTDLTFIGSFKSGNGYTFLGTLYTDGGVNLGVLQWGASAVDGTFYAINANISGTLTVGAGSTMAGFQITSTTVQDVAGLVGLSSLVTGGNDLRIWAGNATPASSAFRVYEDGSLVASSATITGTTGGLTVSGAVTITGAAGSFAMGATPPTGPSTGTGIWGTGTDGWRALSAGVLQTSFTSAGISAAAGKTTLDINGITLAAPSYTGTASDAVVRWLANDTSANIGRILGTYGGAAVNSGLIVYGRGHDVSMNGFAVLTAENYLGVTKATMNVVSDGTSTFDFTGTTKAAAGQSLTVKSKSQTADNALVNEILAIVSNSATSVSNGFGAAISFYLSNSTPADKQAGYLGFNWIDKTAASEDGRFFVNAPINGTATDLLYLDGTSGMNVLYPLKFTTSATGPLLIGGSGTTQTLTYKTTTGVGAAGADHIWQVGNNGATEAMRILNSAFIGMGTASPGTRLHIFAAADNNLGQLKIEGNGVNNAGLSLWTGGGATMRNWQIQNNYNAAGGLSIMRSTTNSGNPTTAVADFDASGNLKLAGSIGTSVPRTIAAGTDAMGVNDSFLICNNAGTVTETLLSAATYPGRILTIKTTTANAVVSASSNVVPMIGGVVGTAILAAAAGKWAILVSDGTNWIIMSSN